MLLYLIHQVWKYFLISTAARWSCTLSPSADGKYAYNSFLTHSYGYAAKSSVPLLKKLLIVFLLGGSDAVIALYGYEAAISSAPPCSDSISSMSNMALHLISLFLQTYFVPPNSSSPLNMWLFHVFLWELQQIYKIITKEDN